MSKIKKRIMYLFVLSICLLTFSPFSVNAFEKNKIVDVTLPQDYVQCTFYVTFENDILRDTTLKSPKGEVFAFEKDLDGKLACTVNDAKAGEWKVIASTKLYDDVDNDENEDNEDSGDATVEDIGKMTINVKSEAESKKKVADSIKIAKEISGLKLYWKDDNLEIEWTDETVGNVNIIVADSKTLQVIQKTTTKEKSFEVPVDPKIEEVIVNIVPSTSAGVNGAEQQFIIKNNYYPEAVITYEDLSITNKDTIEATATIKKSYKLLAVVNDKDVLLLEDLIIGEHKLDIPITEGDNDIKVYVIDDDGNKRSTPFQVAKDTVPPELKIVNDIDDMQTYNNEINIQGTVSDYDGLIFRNEEVTPDWEGNFEVTASLKEGSNNIELKAFDNAGNEAIYNANVTMLVKEPVIIPWNIILPLICIILGVVLLIIFKKRKNNDTALKRTTNSKEKQKSFNVKGNRTEYICFAIVIAIIIITFQGILQRAKAVSNSMEPTINVNEAIYVNKLAYLTKEPQRGDIVIFHSKECNDKILLKRVIGIPGDKIAFCDGYVLINGVVIDESAYLDESIETNCKKEFNVPNNCYFLMGDNRAESYDARYWDNPYIQKKDIIGKMLIKSNIWNTINKTFNL